MLDALRKLLLILASQIPLAGAVYQWREQAQQNQIVTALLAVGYELLILGGVFIKEVWTNELKKDAVKFTADWVRSGVKGFAPGFLRRYRRQIIIEHNIFNVRGLGLIDAVTLNLDQVFVALQIARSSSPAKASLDLVEARELEGSRLIWKFLNVIRRSNAPVALAVIGPPGAGKTTLLQHVAVTLAANRQRRYRSRAYVPVFLFLRQHVSKIMQEKPPSLAQLVQEHFTNKHPIARLNPPPDWFTKRLDAGKCIVLLDGLDEVADGEQRHMVSAWVDQQIESYPECPFILTARPQGYRDAPLKRAHVLELLPFNAGQIRRFIDNWYLASETVSSGNKQDESVRQRAARGSRDLLKALDEKPSLNDLTVNPLLLTMVAMVHRYHGALPGSRIELYAEICQVLLGRWRQAKGVKDKLSAEQKLVVLRPLAAHMMTSKTREVTESGALKVIADPLERIGVSRAEAEKFLADTQSGSGLLQEREAGRWSFAHLTFQEFLTAGHWLDQKELVCEWAAMVSDSWWHETLRLYAAQGDATPVAQACLDADTLPALILAADCLEEAREIAPEVRSALEERLISGLDSDDAERRRIGAEVKLSRRLDSFRRIDDRRAIDIQLLSCAEYQLFLDEMRAQGKYHQPDHWPDHCFAKGEAAKPIAGVRAEDAEAFCEWLTRRQGGEVVYRLPRLDEVGGDALTEGKIAFWCRDKDRYYLYGMAKAIEQDFQKLLESICPAASLRCKPQPLSVRILDGGDLTKVLKVVNSYALTFNLNMLLTVSRLIARVIYPAIFDALNFSLDRDADRAFYLAHTLSRAHDLARTLSRARKHARDLDRDLDRALNFAGDLAKSLNIAHDLILAHARALDYYRTRGLAPEFDHERARSLIYTITHARARARALALAVDLDGASDLDHAVGRDLDHDLDRASDLAQVITRILVIVYDYADNSNNALNRSLDGNLYKPLIAKLNRLDAASEKKPLDIPHLLEDLQIELKYLPRYIRELLPSIFASSSASTPFEARHSQRWFLVRMLEITLPSNQPQLQRSKLGWWRRLAKMETDAGREQMCELAAQLYWWLQIVIAREEGKLPAWEGIHIVRELVE